MIRLICLLNLLSIVCHANDGTIKRHNIANQFIVDTYIPPNYSQKKQYPVIYCNDGEYIFSAAFGLQHLLDSLILEKIIDPVIVVGIHSRGERTSNYIPYKDSWVEKNWGTYQPAAETYSVKIIELIIPYMESNYSTLGKSHRALFGFSFGGLHALWNGLNFKKEYSFVAALSPSLWVNDYQILKDSIDTLTDMKIWFDIGTKEWNYYVPMIQKLEAAGLKSGESLFYYEEPNGDHTNSSWLRRIPYPLILFCGTQKENLNISTISIEEECIPSQSMPGKVFRRLNPIVSLKNGVKYSAISEVKYLATKSMKIDEYGKLDCDSAFKLRYTYMDLSGEKDIDCCQ